MEFSHVTNALFSLLATVQRVSIGPFRFFGARGQEVKSQYRFTGIGGGGGNLGATSAGPVYWQVETEQKSSIPHSLVPRLILINPFAPQVGPQEFLTNQ